MAKKLNLFIMAGFYLMAGINHFIRPSNYLEIIPPYFSSPAFINAAAGTVEILLALLLLFPKTRKIACYGIVLMLLSFIPAHIYMLKTGFCVNDFCLPQWALWVRLLLMQPLLIIWALKTRH